MFTDVHVHACVHMPACACGVRTYQRESIAKLRGVELAIVIV